VFRNLPPETNSGSTANQKCLDITVKCFKVIAYLITFSVVLICGMITKGIVLFMTSQIKPNRKLKYCNRELGS
jgi:chitin synthase